MKRLVKRLIPRTFRPAVKTLYYRSLPAPQRRALLARQLRSQAEVCSTFGSPLYGALLGAAAADVEAKGPCWGVLAQSEPTALGSDDALALRFMGAVHRLVLEGRAPDLAPYYPSVGGNAPVDGAWPVFRKTVEEEVETLRDLAEHPVQTNEVGRCAVLAGGFLHVARTTGLPLRILEMGASAGLNLRWDHYLYETAGSSWGPPDSPVRLGSAYVEGRPPLDSEARVAERQGCDLAPIDPSSPDGRLSLMSYVWADQTRRFELLRGALEVAQRVPLAVDKADGPTWLARQLEKQVAGVATVAFHSFVTQFLDDEGRSTMAHAFERAGARATANAPVAWLRMEWGSGRAETRLTTWPGGSEILLATSTPQGWDIHWLAEPTEGQATPTGSHDSGASP